MEPTAKGLSPSARPSCPAFSLDFPDRAEVLARTACEAYLLLTQGSPPTSEPETLKPYRRGMGQKGRGRQLQVGVLSAESERRKLPAPGTGEQEGKVAPLIGVGQGPAGGRTTVEGSFLCACNRCSAPSLECTGRAAKPRFPRAVCKREGRKGKNCYCSSLWMWRELRKETACPWPLCLLGPSFLGPQAGTELRLF